MGPVKAFEACHFVVCMPLVDGLCGHFAEGERCARHCLRTTWNALSGAYEAGHYGPKSRACLLLWHLLKIFDG